MNRTLIVLSALAVLAAVPLTAQEKTGAAPAAEGSPKVSALKVGVVDFVRVIDAYPKAIEERKKVDELRKQQLTTLDAEVKKLREMQIKLADLQRGSRGYELAQHEIRLKQQDIEGTQSLFERDWRRAFDQFLVTVYADLERAVAIVAKDRGVHMVVRAHPELEGGSAEDRARVYETRMVWYASEEIDLTPAVIQLLQVPLPPDPKAVPAANDKPVEGQKPANGDKKDPAGG